MRWSQDGTSVTEPAGWQHHTVEILHDLCIPLIICHDKIPPDV